MSPTNATANKPAVRTSMHQHTSSNPFHQVHRTTTSVEHVLANAPSVPNAPLPHVVQQPASLTTSSSQPESVSLIEL
jgi:hypothetical protein